MSEESQYYTETGELPPQGIGPEKSVIGTEKHSWERSYDRPLGSPARALENITLKRMFPICSSCKPLGAAKYAAVTVTTRSETGDICSEVEERKTTIRCNDLVNFRNWLLWASEQEFDSVTLYAASHDPENFFARAYSTGLSQKDLKRLGVRIREYLSSVNDLQVSASKGVDDVED